MNTHDLAPRPASRGARGGGGIALSKLLFLLLIAALILALFGAFGRTTM